MLALHTIYGSIDSDSLTEEPVVRTHGLYS